MRIENREAQNFIYMKKIKIIWIINLALFVFCVYLGVYQSTKGAEIANLEKQIEENVLLKRESSENIFESSSETRVLDSISSLGFTKPATVFYVDSEEAFLSLR